jgi:hypothetical protein
MSRSNLKRSKCTKNAQDKTGKTEEEEEKRGRAETPHREGLHVKTRETMMMTILATEMGTGDGDGGGNQDNRQTTQEIATTTTRTQI